MRIRLLKLRLIFENWQDEANRYGGKWIVRLRKGLASRCWENLIMAMLGEQFMVGEEICGAVVSVRYQEDILSIWNKSANDTGLYSNFVNNQLKMETAIDKFIYFRCHQSHSRYIQKSFEFASWYHYRV